MIEKAAVDFLTLVAAGHVALAYERYVGQDFRHHNPYFRAGADALRDAMVENAIASPQKSLDVKTVLREGDRVAVFSHIRQHPGDRGAAVVHLFRFDRAKIVELWDVGQTIPEDLVNEDGVF